MCEYAAEHFVCVTWLVDICPAIHPCVPWLIHVCRDPLTRVPCLAKNMQPSSSRASFMHIGVVNESRNTCAWVMPHTYEWVMGNMCRSCWLIHMCEWVMGNMSVTHMNESQAISVGHEWVIGNMISRLPNIMSLLQKSPVKETLFTYEWVIGNMSRSWRSYRQHE